MGGKRNFRLKAKMGGKSVNKSQCDHGANQNTSTGVDWISGLPDDILVGILSTLPLKEAARTSILSPRWENLWKHTSRLDFDADAAICRLVRHRTNMESLSPNERQRRMEKVRRLERRKYINWVNKVIMRSYKGLALKELRICFDLDKSSSQKAIDRWLQFAFERHVERLELDLSIEGDLGRNSDVYALPRKKLFNPQYHQPRSLFDSLKYLKALSLKSVDLTDRDVDVILRSCPLLEHLVIQDAFKISYLNICGDLALKHLEIRCCPRIKTFKISAPNLSSLVVFGTVPPLLEKVPKLVDVNVSFFDEDVPKLVPALFCCLSQLEILTLELSLNKGLMDKFSKIKNPPHALPKLNKLEIIFSGQGDESMIGLTCLIRAAPCLQEFVIKLDWYKLLRTRKNVKNDHVHSPHQHLKVVKFLGYYGRSSDVELVRYLLDKCVVLETLIIDPRYQNSYHRHMPLDPDDFDGLVVKRELPEGYKSVTVYPDKFDGMDAVQTSRKYAKTQLQGKIRQDVELVIL